MIILLPYKELVCDAGAQRAAPAYRPRIPEPKPIAAPETETLHFELVQTATAVTQGNPVRETSQVLQTVMLSNLWIYIVYVLYLHDLIVVETGVGVELKIDLCTVQLRKYNR